MDGLSTRLVDVYSVGALLYELLTGRYQTARNAERSQRERAEASAQELIKNLYAARPGLAALKCALPGVDR